MGMGIELERVLQILLHLGAFAVPIAIVLIVFLKFKEKSLARRGIVAFGFLAVFVAVITILSMHSMPWILAAGAFAFGIEGLLEVWEKKRE